MFLSLNSNTTGATGEPGTSCHSGAHGFTPGFLWVSYFCWRYVISKKTKCPFQNTSGCLGIPREQNILSTKQCLFIHFLNFCLTGLPTSTTNWNKSQSNCKDPYSRVNHTTWMLSLVFLLVLLGFVLFMWSYYMSSRFLFCVVKSGTIFDLERCSVRLYYHLCCR